MTLSRRKFLGTACSAAASPLMTPVVFAAAPGDNRLVMIVLRGAMDGIGAVMPHGDPAYRQLRPKLARQTANGMSDLDGFWGLNKAFAPLMPLWRAGELGFVQAVSTPYRNKRSHFDGQDFLENGGSDTSGQLTRGRDGWLNRALAHIPGAHADYAMAVGRSRLLLLEGQARSGSWSPTTDLSLINDERGLLSLLYSGDPVFAEAMNAAGRLSESTSSGQTKQESGQTLAAFAADMLNARSRIAAFSIGGWDTHRNQPAAMGRAARSFNDAVLTLKKKLGRNWDRTTVIAVTEFGRTARENGSLGTDHGTGGMMILAGGAVRGGRILGRWPGLDEGNLYQNRDVLPTDDVRRYAGWALRGLFGVSSSVIARDIFPGLDMGGDPGMLA